MANVFKHLWSDSENKRPLCGFLGDSIHFADEEEFV